MTTIQTNSVPSSLMDAMNPSTTASSSSTVDDAQNRFMTLLVTQMKNQDPLNPLDNAQVTSQLAQLSTVTGIDKLNTTLSSLMTNFQSSQSLQAAGMIGHSVLVPGSTIDLANKQGAFGIELAGPADSVKVSVLDASGKVVHSMDLGAQQAGDLPFAWDGTTDAGGAAADGQYTFKVDATNAGQKVDATALAFGQVASVSAGSQGVKLNLPTIGAVNLGDVRQIL